MKRTKYVDQWLEKADHDLEAARLLLEAEHFTDTICFHIHQSVEKNLKAFLIANEVRPKRTHDLKELLEICIKFDSDFSGFMEDLDKISNYYIPTRYPIAEPIIYSIEETRESLDSATYFKTFILKKIDNIN